MCKKLIYLISFVLVLGLAGNALGEDADPPPFAGASGSGVARWEFDVEPPDPTAYGYYPTEPGDLLITQDFCGGSLEWNEAEETITHGGETNWYISCPDGEGDYLTIYGQITHTGGEGDSLYPGLEMWENPRESGGGYMGGWEGDGMDSWEHYEIEAGVWQATFYHTIDRTGEDMPPLVSIWLEFDGDIQEIILDAVVHSDPEPPEGTGARPWASLDPYIAKNGQPQGDVCADAVTELVWDDPCEAEALLFDVWFEDSNEVVDTNHCDVLVELEWDTEYIWSVDTIEPNGARHAGLEWSFSTGGLASNPTPEDGAGCIDSDPDLYWEGDGCQDGFNLVVAYNEELVDPILDETITDPFYLELAGLAPTATIYWRVNECDSEGEALAEGEVWSFETKAADPPYDDYVGVGHDECMTTVFSGLQADNMEGREDPGGQLLNGEGIDSDDWTTEDGGDYWLGIETEWWGEASDEPYPLTGEPSDSTWIMIDLGWVYPELRQMWIWNCNANWTWSGVRYYNVHYSDGGAGDPWDWDWTAITGLELPQAESEPGNGEGYAGYEGSPGPDFGGASARYILITSLENWNGNWEWASLNEVKIELKPPTKATLPVPKNGATDVPIDTCLEWKPGAFVADEDGHKVYLGSESEVEITSENEKKITLEITWNSPDDLVPQGDSWGWEDEFNVWWPDISDVCEVDLGNGWKKTTYVFTVEPNPIGEVICFFHEGEDEKAFYIDKIVIDTDCNPSIEGGQTHSEWTFDTDEQEVYPDPHSHDEGIFDDYFAFQWADVGENGGWVEDYNGLTGVWKLGGPGWREIGFELGNYAEEYEEIVIPYADTVSDPCYCPELVFSTTYFWRVDEINDANVWKGNVWRFTVADYLVVDDMDSYTPWNVAGNHIYEVWVDGSGDCDEIPGNGTGSTVVLEEWIASDSNSMKFSYDNDGMAYNPCPDVEGDEERENYSMAKAQVADLPSGIGSDWTLGGAKALALQFYGSTGNAIESMWVELTDGAGGKATVTYGDYKDEDPNDIGDPSWHEWNIDLQDFADGDVDLTNVSSIAIGFGSPTATSPGGSGEVYFDDIRLYPTRCLLSLRSPDFARVDYVQDCVVDYKEVKVMAESWLVAGAAPGEANLVAWYEFEGDASDSGPYGFHGDPRGAPTYSTDCKEGSYAIELNGDGDCVGLGDDPRFNPGADDFSISVWINMSSYGDDWANVIIGKRGEGGLGWQLRRLADTHRISFTTRGGGDEDGWGDGGQDISLNEWHHVAAVRDGTEKCLYIDGQREAVSGIEDYINDCDHNVYIGTRANADNTPEEAFFNGMIDDVRIYNKALTDAEIVGFCGLRADLYEDKKIDFKDFAELAVWWLDEQLVP